MRPQERARVALSAASYRERGRGRGARGGAVAPRQRHRAASSAAKRRRTIAIIASIIALGLVATVLYRPVMRVLESRRSLARAEEKLAEEKAKTQELEERLQRDLSEEYVEGEARRMGYVMPGEIPLIVLDEKEGASQEGGEQRGAESERADGEQSAASSQELP